VADIGRMIQRANVVVLQDTCRIEVVYEWRGWPASMRGAVCYWVVNDWVKEIYWRVEVLVDTIYL
jgi:hypothetical protein